MDPQRAQELLSRERNRLERALADLDHNGGDGDLTTLGRHMADAGTELFEEERDAGIAARVREELEAVKRAELRLRAGSYGLSIDSGIPIPDARLEAMPWAERTTEEQQRFERTP